MDKSHLKVLKVLYHVKIGFCSLQEPQRITVGHKSVQRRSGPSYKEFLRDDEIMYIPLLQILEQLLNMDFVLAEVIVCFV